MKLDPLESVIEDVRAGKLIVIIDDKDRENEGDLMVAAEKATSENIAFMIEEGKGLVCLSLTKDRVRELGIPLQVSENTTVFGTNFTVSIDHRSVGDRGVSASARARTIRETVKDGNAPQDFVMPGYVFPLAAVDGGVLKRRGQTEGSVDLARLAGLKPAGVICEVMDDEGLMLSGEALQVYCAQHNLKVTSVEAIIEYRLRHEVSVRRTADAVINDLSHVGRNIKTDESLRLVSYVDDVDSKEHLAFIVGEPKDGALVRLHSECVTGDIFESTRCDCGGQFEQSLAAILRAGEGVLVYLQQEGRGIGLANKLQAYQLQDQGLDTVEANIRLGFAPDLRNYRVGAQILSDLGLKEVRLLTNNPEKVSSLEDFGIQVYERVPLVTEPNPDNTVYLRAKRDRMGHLFPEF